MQSRGAKLMAIKIIKKPKRPFSHIPDPLGHGQRAVDYLRSLKHPKSDLPKQAFQLDPWQEEIVRRIYGPRDEFGRRIVRNVFILVPRGNRKTSLAAGLALLHSEGPEARAGGEVLFAASDRTQAKVGFREVQNVIEASFSHWSKGQQNRRFSAVNDIRLREYIHKIDFPNNSFIEALGCDAATVHGRTPVFAMCDEIHAWGKRDLFDVIRTGLAKTPGSLCVIITTAGKGQQHFSWELLEYARKVAKGEIDDPATLAVLYETDPKRRLEG